jgi:hypothetical protein
MVICNQAFWCIIWSHEPTHAPCTEKWIQPISQSYSQRPILIAFIHLRLNLPSGLFHLRFHTKKTKWLISHACYKPRAAHPRWFHHSNIWWWGHIMKLFIMQIHSTSNYFILLGPKFIPRTFLSQTVSPCSSLKVTDQISRPHNYNQITVVYILIIMFLNIDRLCGPVVRVGYRSRGPGSTPDATRFSEK